MFVVVHPVVVVGVVAVSVAKYNTVVDFIASSGAGVQAVGLVPFSILNSEISTV